MSIRLYVGNLPAELDREGLEKIFSESGESVSLKIINDTKTGKCRGFGFVTVETPELASSVIEKFNGYDFNGSLLKLEEALPRTKSKANDESPDSESPTPKVNKQNHNKSRRSGNERNIATSEPEDESHQPDPRWANQLEKFKQQLLAAQSAN